MMFSSLRAKQLDVITQSWSFQSQLESSQGKGVKYFVHKCRGDSTPGIVRN